jgi:hypothetical protein
MQIDGVNFNEEIPDDVAEDTVNTIIGDEDVLNDMERARQIVAEIVGVRGKIKKLKKEEEKLKKEADGFLAPIHMSFGIRGVEGDWGSMTFFYGSNTKFDKQVLQEELVKGGVPLQVVTAAIKKATITTPNNNLTMDLKKK